MFDFMLLGDTEALTSMGVWEIFRNVGIFFVAYLVIRVSFGIVRRMRYIHILQEWIQRSEFDFSSGIIIGSLAAAAWMSIGLFAANYTPLFERFAFVAGLWLALILPVAIAVEGIVDDRLFMVFIAIFVFIQILLLWVSFFYELPLPLGFLILIPLLVFAIGFFVWRAFTADKK